MRSPITPAGILLLVLASSACASVKGAESRTGESPRELSSTPRPTGQNARGSAINPATPALAALVPRGPGGRLCLAEIEDDIWLRSREVTFLSRPAPQPTCPYSVELAITADDAWEVFIDGQKLIPTNGSAENDWRVPARYETVVHSSGSNLVIAIHAKDVEGVVSGVLASVRVQRVSPPSLFQPVVLQTGDGFGWYAFQPSVSATPPADWHTTPYLPFASGTQADWAPATPAAACLGSWSGSATFLNNWASISGGAAPTGWVWELDCDAGAASWRQENWYRIDVPVDYCPSDSPPPSPDGACCIWTLTSHGAADGLFDTPPVQGCTTDTGSTPPQAICIDRIGCHWIPSVCKYACGFDFWSWSCL